jgi:hypothetical protein
LQASGRQKEGEFDVQSFKVLVKRICEFGHLLRGVHNLKGKDESVVKLGEIAKKMTGHFKNAKYR